MIKKNSTNRNDLLFVLHKIGSIATLDKTGGGAISNVEGISWKGIAAGSLLFRSHAKTSFVIHAQNHEFPTF